MLGQDCKAAGQEPNLNGDRMMGSEHRIAGEALHDVDMARSVSQDKIPPNRQSKQPTEPPQPIDQVI